MSLVIIHVVLYFDNMGDEIRNMPIGPVPKECQVWVMSTSQMNSMKFGILVFRTLEHVIIPRCRERFSNVAATFQNGCVQRFHNRFIFPLFWLQCNRCKRLFLQRFATILKLSWNQSETIWNPSETVLKPFKYRSKTIDTCSGIFEFVQFWNNSEALHFL